jgi:hypothetical protein
MANQPKPAPITPASVKMLALAGDAETAVRGLKGVANLLAALCTGPHEVEAAELEVLCDLLHKHAEPLARLQQAASNMDVSVPTQGELREARRALERRFADRVAAVN